jgi:mono/diheme cytochrome c family protein
MRNVAATIVALAVVAASPSPGGSTDLQDFSLVNRGRYLVDAADCTSCHTVPGSNQPFAGGRPIETPFGTLISPNITPDPDTGIGTWTDDEFDTAVRLGRTRNGAHLYPAMPYPYYTKMSRDDIEAIRAYLNTVTAVHNDVRANQNQLPFPLNIRKAMAVWNRLYFKPGEFQPQADKSAEWNRGAYLVQGPGHCGACHTPKTVLGGDESAKALRGYALQGWFAPDITSGQGALANWTVDDIATYLGTGHNRNAAAAGLMGEVVTLSTSKMSDADLRAMAVYLKDVSGSALPSGSPAGQDVLAAGGAIYQDLCSSCHAADGKGVPNMFPNLAEAATVSASDPTTVLRVILQGAQSVATDKEPTGPAMPAFGWQLNDVQVAAVASYIRDRFGKKASAVTEEQVQKMRSQLAVRSN